jgi:hypothetical protein
MNVDTILKGIKIPANAKNIDYVLTRIILSSPSNAIDSLVSLEIQPIRFDTTLVEINY